MKEKKSSKKVYQYKEVGKEQRNDLEMEMNVLWGHQLIYQGQSTYELENKQRLNPVLPPTSNLSQSILDMHKLFMWKCNLMQTPILELINPHTINK